MRFRVKIIFTIIVIAAMISVITSIVYYQKTSAVIEMHYRASISENVRNQAVKLDNMMRQMYYLSITVSCDQELISFIKDQQQGNDRLLDISVLLHKYYLSDPNVDSIYVYLPSEKKVVQAQQYKAMKQLDQNKEYTWISTLAARENNIRPMMWRDDIGSTRKYIFVYSRPIRDAQTGEILAEVALNLDERQVYFACLDSLNHSAYTRTELADEENIIVSSKKLANLGGTLDDAFVSPKALSEQVLQAPFSGYRFVTTLDVAVLTKSLAELRDFIIQVSLATMGLTVFLAFFFSQRLYVPVKNLKEAMRRLSEGDLQARAVPQGKDEIAILSSRFNSMADRIETLVSELVTEESLKKEAKLESLTYQITPHFMYNTLHSIKCAAFLQKAHGIEKLLDAFIELLQGSISKKGAFLMLKDELKLVQNYVLLQQFRHQHRFQVECRIDSASEELYVPRLIIQPLVENSIFHGLDMKSKHNQIIISAELTEAQLIISVEDNGKGMNPETTESGQKGKKEQFNGIGIKNIQERIRLYYGDRGSMVYEEGRAEGTKATISLPVAYHKDDYALSEDEMS